VTREVATEQGRQLHLNLRFDLHGFTRGVLRLLVR